MQRYKKRKINKKKVLCLVIPLIIIITLLINIHPIINYCQSKITGYQYSTIKLFHELNIYKDIKKHEYSKTLEETVKTEYFNKKYLNDYLDIKEHDNPTFIKDVNTLLTLGYTADDINAIYGKLSDESIELLLNNNYLKDIINILNLAYFKEENLNRYITYSQDKQLEYVDLITYVNIGLDKSYYTDVINIENVDDPLVLVNKYNALPSNYVPNDLENINNKYNKGYNNKLRSIARIAFEEMCEAALNDGITIYSGSAYRSYNYQLNLYNRYVAQDGKEKAETYSARAGYSEHQTGLATDIMNARLEYISKSDKEYEWLVNNSYKYGFILRYPEGKEDITGYIYEEWHFRYIDKNIAEYLYQNNLTYDEYVARNS